MSKAIKFICLTIILTLSANLSVYADNTNSLEQQIQQNNSQINNLEDEKNKLNAEIETQSSELQNILNEINSKSEELNKAKAEVDEYSVKINEVQQEIDDINNSIYEKEIEISTKEALIKEKEEEKLERENLLDERIRIYYKIDIGQRYIYTLLESKSITDFFSTMQNIIKIMKLDKELISELKEIQTLLEEERKSIEENLVQIEASKEEVINRQNELVQAQQEYIEKQNYHQSKIDELYALENQKSEIIGELSYKEQEVSEQLGDLVSYNSQLQAELDNLFADLNNSGSSGSSGDSGSSGSSGDDGYIGDPSQETFLRPGYGVVTDTYGPRINPVTGVAGFHTGVDFADPYGANVSASKSGEVIYSGWINGYGNTVIIDHGNGVQTLYGHNSELLVSVGQRVSRGETIALVGSTGMSTGPHIHFEIRINGQHVNPLDYL